MATIQDIADAAGISKAAVSRILNHKGSFSQETIRRVEDIARKMNYISVSAARQEDAEGIKLIAAVFPTQITPYYGILTSLMEGYAYDYGYHLMLCGSLYDYEKEEELFRNLTDRKIKGILLGSFVKDGASIAAQSLPVVTIGYQINEEVPTVRTDNYSGGRIAALHLCGKGCKKLLYLTGFEAGLEKDMRYQGFKDALKEQGKEVYPYTITLDQKLNGTIQDVITRMALEHPDADGLFAESQRLAMESIAVYRNLGIEVPKSMKIVGYGNPYLLPYSSPKLSLIRENTAEIARQAVEVLVQMIERPEEPVPPVTVIPVSFEQNQTT